jgi:predicted amidohydrolase YtcJ
LADVPATASLTSDYINLSLAIAIFGRLRAGLLILRRLRMMMGGLMLTFGTRGRARRVLTRLSMLVALVQLGGQTAALADTRLIIVNAKIMTMEPQQAEASAMAMEGGVITFVGDDAGARALAGPDTAVIDAKGRTVVPGFTDVHMHPRAQFDEMALYGRLDLTPAGGVANRVDLVAKLKRKVAVTPPGMLIVGERYQDDLIGGHPTAAELDVIAPHNPVILVHSSGHRRSVNSMALSLAGITDTTPNPPGAAIERDANGKATGIILEGVPGFRKLYDTLPEPTADQVRDGFVREFKMFLSHGLVGVGDAGMSPDKLAIYRDLLRGGMPVRINAIMSFDHLDWMIANRWRDEWQVPGLTLQAIKVFHGNSLSGRTAWLYEPYAHDPTYYGIAPARSQDELNQLIARIHNAGLQVAVHSNGDREIDMTLNAIAAAQAANPRPDPRHRIEHGSLATASALYRMRELGAALAPHSYLLNHGGKLEDFGAQRLLTIEPNRAALGQGIAVGGNSDHPVSPPFVMQRIESLVTRRAASNGKAYGPDQRLTVEQALQTWTSGSAYLQFEEKSHGSIKAGKRADVVVLSADPRRVDPDAIETIRVDYTVIGGEIAYQRAQDGKGDLFPWSQ